MCCRYALSHTYTVRTHVDEALDVVGLTHRYSVMSLFTHALGVRRHMDEMDAVVGLTHTSSVRS